MRIFTSLLFLLLFCIILPSSCKKDDDSLTPDDDCQISAFVDGVPYRWELLETCSLINDRLQIGDIAVDEAEFTISPMDSRGSYATINPNFTITLFLTLDATTQIYAADVEIEVSSFSTTAVNGSFEGIFTDVSGNTYQVENGKFRGVF